MQHNHFLLGNANITKWDQVKTMKKIFLISYYFEIEHVLLDKGVMLFIEALCFPFPFANSLMLFQGLLVLPLLFKLFLSFYMNYLHIKKGRVAIKVQRPPTLLNLLFMLCKGRGYKFFFFQDFLSLCIIVMF